jgi:NO-binding membrane sensor protein with MHYT domain/hemoglobin-like flavoprotein
MTVFYQPVLVLLSIGVAILGSLTALALTALSQEEDASQKGFMLANGALIMGATIWSMHFVAMMAVEFPIVVNYSLLETLGSVAIAIVATGIGLYIASSSAMGKLSIPFGGVLMGLGIGGMHYLGMGAIRGCGLAYDLRLVAASVAIAISASTAALWFAFYKRTVLMSLGGGIVQGLAIASMHYTAMAATYFVPLGVDFEISKPIFAQSVLAYMIAGGLSAIAVGNLALLTMIRRDPLTSEQVQQVQESFRRIEPFAPLVGEVFYRRLFEIAPHLRALFPGDLADQGAKLMAMLSIAVANLDKAEDLHPMIAELGRRHAAYGARDEDYELVGEALIWTLEQGLRDAFTPEVKSAWLATYQMLTGTMRTAAAELQPVKRGFMAPMFGRRAA